MTVERARIIVNENRQRENRDREVVAILDIMLKDLRLNDDCIHIYVCGDKKIRVNIHDKRDINSIPQSVEDYQVEVKVTYKPALVGW